MLTGPPQFIGEVQVRSLSRCGNLSTYELRTKTVGNPKPRVSWIKDSVPVIPDARVRLLSSPHQGLLIRDFKPSDFGMYRVTLSNSYGKIYREVRCCGKPFKLLR